MQSAAVATLLGVEGAGEGTDVFAATSAATLKFEATLFSVTFADGVLTRSKAHDHGDAAAAGTQQPLGKFWADESSVTQGEWMCMSLCVVIKSAGYGEGEIVADKVAGDGIWCLVLEEVDGEKGVFERVGVCRVVDEERGVEIMELLEGVREVVIR
ncbi:hypothetical protein IQ07DRAFT_645903 [Pyrenochaeta sp. DS3sAY3a]|nr:hypothetical protein IQ07DRAFT_645903 [Pyrenochaeta sp. DS3sAY3a]